MTIPSDIVDNHSFRGRRKRVALLKARIEVKKRSDASAAVVGC